MTRGNIRLYFLCHDEPLPEECLYNRANEFKNRIPSVATHQLMLLVLKTSTVQYSLLVHQAEKIYTLHDLCIKGSRQRLR